MLLQRFVRTLLPFVILALVALGGQILATVGLNVLVEVGMAMWGRLKDLGPVEAGEELVVKNILADAG